MLCAEPRVAPTPSATLTSVPTPSRTAVIVPTAGEATSTSDPNRASPTPIATATDIGAVSPSPTPVINDPGAGVIFLPLALVRKPPIPERRST